MAKRKSKPKSNRGGARPGAGRKSAAVRKLRDDFNTVVRETIVDWLPELLVNLKALADGIEVQKTDAKGREVVYSQPPDRAANQYLIDRVCGKPIDQAVESAKSTYAEIPDDEPDVEPRVGETET